MRGQEPNFDKCQLANSDVLNLLEQSPTKVLQYFSVSLPQCLKTLPPFVAAELSFQFLISIAIFFFFFFVFLGPHPKHMKVPRLGVEWEL